MTLTPPRYVRLEAASICQLRCPLCPTTRGEVRDGAAGSGLLSLENFGKFLTRNPAVQHIELSNYGEIFLNKQLAVILELAHQKRVQITMANGVNLNRASDELLESLVKYRVKTIAVSIDGTNQQTYEQYRVGGHFDMVIENIRKINSYKKAYRTPAPILVWQFVVFGHNEHELPKAHKMATDLQMMFVAKSNWDPAFSPRAQDSEIQRTPANADTHLPFTNPPASQQVKDTWTEFLQSPCSQLWVNPQINWDGKILGCCVNYWQDLGGNAFELTPNEWYNSPGIQAARAIVRGKEPAGMESPCARCDIYQEMAAKDAFLQLPDRYSDGV